MPERPFHDVPDPEVPLRIDCGDCSRQGTPTCQDCVVTFLCTNHSGQAVVIDVFEARALRLLGEGGLAPRLQHRRRTG